MQRFATFLAVLLAAQLALTAGLSINRPELTAARPNAELVSFDRQAVEQVRIEGPDEAEIVLARDGERWVLPGNDGFPAAPARVERLLESVGGLERGFAVATSADARARLRVAEDAFERRLTFSGGDMPEATLYVGTSAGANQVHARAGGDANVYLVEFGAFDAPVESEDWQDDTTLQIPRDRIDAITTGGVTLRRAVPEASDAEDPAPRWVLQGDAPANATANRDNVDALVSQLAALRTGRVLGTGARESYGLADPALELDVQTADGERIELRLGSRGEDEPYVLKSSARPEYFELGRAAAERLIDAASSSRLVTTQDDADEDDAAQDGESTAVPE